MSNASETNGAEFEPPQDDRGGVIYACVEQGERYVKIGWAASLENAYVRWINIQIGNPRRLDMRLIGDGSLRDEACSPRAAPETRRSRRVVSH